MNINIHRKWKVFALGQVFTAYEGDPELLFDRLNEAVNDYDVDAIIGQHEASIWSVFEDVPLMQLGEIVIGLARDAQEVAQ